MKFIITLFFSLFFLCNTTISKENIELSKWLDSHDFPKTHTSDFKEYESRGLKHRVDIPNWSPDIWYSYKEDFTSLFEKVCEIQNDSFFVHVNLISNIKSDYIVPLSYITKLITKNKPSIVDLNTGMNNLKNKFGVSDIVQLEKNSDAVQIVYKFNHYSQPIAVNFYINKSNCLYASAYYYK